MRLPECYRGHRNLPWSSLAMILLAILAVSAPIGHAIAAGEEGEEECESRPSCRLVPNVNLIEALVGVPFSVTICGVSNCGNDVRIESWHLNPRWCDPVDTDSRGGNSETGEELCYDLICTPPLTAIGTRTFKFKITDLGNGESTWCEFQVRTTLPCLDVPNCRTIPEGVIEVVAGDSFSFEFCASSDCTDHRFAILPVMVPSWCHPEQGMMDNELSMPTGEHCFTVNCNPPLNTPPDRYWIKIKVIDLETGFQEVCVLDVDIVAPECSDPPVCEISQPVGFRSPNDDAESFKLTVGDTGGFQICGTSPCGNDLVIDTSSLPDFCRVNMNDGDGSPCGLCAGGGGHEGPHTECLWITCEPEAGDEGQHHATIWVTDLENDKRSRCDVWFTVNGLCETEPPVCSIAMDGESPSEAPFRVLVGEPFGFEVCGDAACDDHRVRVAPSSLPPFVTNPGHRTGAAGAEVCLDVQGQARSQDIGSWNVHFLVTDIDSGLSTDCWKRIIVEGEPVCEERPTCSIEPGGEILSGPGATHSIEICGTPLCEDNAVEIVAEELPAFCGPFETVTGEAGELVCATLSCTVPIGVEPGTYTIKFRVRDTTNGRSSVCTTQLLVPEPAQVGCFEPDEPNNGFSQCSLFDVGACFDIGCGSSITGMLDQSGSDFDYYCVAGLEPFSEYSVTIIGGVDQDGMPGCYALACIGEDGGIVSSTNSGQAMGFPSLVCIATGDGNVFFAVSGCDDLDIDGQQDPVGEDRGGIGHGSRGSYVIAVNFDSSFSLAPACHADMNGDGIVDSADLGMLIGMFGSLCDR